MNIQDAFDLTQAQALDTTLTTEEADELHGFIDNVIDQEDRLDDLTAPQMEGIRQLAMYAFIAGRSYQTDVQQAPVTLELQSAEASLYIQFLHSLLVGGE